MMDWSVQDHLKTLVFVEGMCDFVIGGSTPCNVFNVPIWYAYVWVKLKMVEDHCSIAETIVL